MIVIRKRECSINEPWEKLFSKLDWQVDRSDNFMIDRVSTQLVKADKEWNGKIDKTSKSFLIVKTRGFPKIYLPLILVAGKIEENNESKISLNFELGPFTIIFYFLIFGSTILLTTLGIIFGELSEFLIDWILWVLIFQDYPL